MTRNRAKGVLLGLACGDALGRPVEFRQPREIEAEHGTVTDMLGHGTHGQPAGTVTDDTQLAMCIARSLRECGGFEPADIASRFVDWYHDDPFDIGLTTVDALRQLDTGTAWDEAGRVVWEAAQPGKDAGNGSVMWCAPLAIAYAEDPDRLIEVSRLSSQITHYDPRCQWGCAILNLTIANRLHGDGAPLSSALDRVDGEAPDELVGALRDVPEGIDPDKLRTTGYVVTTLQTALYHGLHAETPREAIVEAVNMGGDADTIGAIAGAVAGAQGGAKSLPESWLTALQGVTTQELRNASEALERRAFD